MSFKARIRPDCIQNNTTQYCKNSFEERNFSLATSKLRVLSNRNCQSSFALGNVATAMMCVMAFSAWLRFEHDVIYNNKYLKMYADNSTSSFAVLSRRNAAVNASAHVPQPPGIRLRRFRHRNLLLFGSGERLPIYVSQLQCSVLFQYK